MKQENPSAYIAINKSRLKQYSKNNSLPVYYLEKSSEFQIELFNPTKDTVLAVISLNSKQISQGGLILRPGERVFLDRYLDVAKKFKFDTYEVSNTAEVREAIEDNGDFKVEFYRESTPSPYNNLRQSTANQPYWNYMPTNYSSGTVTTTIPAGITPTGAVYGTMVGCNSAFYTAANVNPVTFANSLADEPKSKSKSIETGRVEEGSHSNQKMDVVHKNWEYFPFWSIQAKLLPLSQKVNTVQDVQVKRYCTSCGAKLHKTDRFCSTCGKKA